MSVQVSYKKQTAFFILAALVILAILESSSRIYEYVEPDCFFIGADATKNIESNRQHEMCKENSLLKIYEYPVYSLEPNQHLTTININSHGFRGAEFSIEKNPETYRIMMVGGSTTFGSGASSDHTTIPAFLEKEFHKNNLNVEIINAGVSAANSFEEAFKIKQQYKKFKPDLFIVYDGLNDGFGKVVEGELDIEISRSELVQSAKSPIQIWISENLKEFRTLYVIYPYFSHMYIASTMNDELLEKNSDTWSSRWNDVCDENNKEGIKTIILLQPIVGTGSKQLSPDEKNHADYVKQVKTREQLEYFSKTFPIPSCTASLDLRNVFDGYSQPVYFDGGHTVDLGNKKIASKIFDQISSFIENDIRRIT